MTSEDEQSQKEPVSLSSLPDEIIENILARISKWTYPNLCLVSKRFLSLLSSSEVYTTRSNLETAEPCLYFCMDSFERSQCYALWMKHDEFLTSNDEILNDYSLIPLPCSSSRSSCAAYKSTVAVGSDIYEIGGHYDGPTSSVRILDCQSHMWRDAPNMMVAREDAQAVYLDEKIYVLGGCEEDESANWLEVFDIKTQTWRALPSPGADHELRRPYIKVNSDAFEGKLYVAAETKEYTYDPKDGIWQLVREESCINNIMDWCVIENVMYCWTYLGCLEWYDSKDREWREIKGLRELHLHHLQAGLMIAIASHGGKLDNINSSKSMKKIEAATFSSSQALNGVASPKDKMGQDSNKLKPTLKPTSKSVWVKKTSSSPMVIADEASLLEDKARATPKMKLVVAPEDSTTIKLSNRFLALDHECAA